MEKHEFKCRDLSKLIAFWRSRTNRIPAQGKKSKTNKKKASAFSNSQSSTARNAINAFQNYRSSATKGLSIETLVSDDYAGRHGEKNLYLVMNQNL